MNTDPIGNRILVLCDNEGLGNSIAEQLGVGMEAISCTPMDSGGEAPFRHVGSIDMIVVVASILSSEPAKMLFEASLLKYLGQLPLLIVSHKPCHAEASDRMYHLSFPCDKSVLCERVRSILREQQISHSLAPRL